QCQMRVYGLLDDHQVFFGFRRLPSSSHSRARQTSMPEETASYYIEKCRALDLLVEELWLDEMDCHADLEEAKRVFEDEPILRHKLEKERLEQLLADIQAEYEVKIDESEAMRIKYKLYKERLAAEEIETEDDGSEADAGEDTSSDEASSCDDIISTTLTPDDFYVFRFSLHEWYHSRMFVVAQIGLFVAKSIECEDSRRRPRPGIGGTPDAFPRL
ncbi:unnamed protein product, partial [Caenorhabditis auriculariae]